MLALEYMICRGMLKENMKGIHFPGLNYVQVSGTIAISQHVRQYQFGGREGGWGLFIIFGHPVQYTSTVDSVVKIKVLGVSGPPGLPTLLAPASETVPVTAISALSFSPDGEVQCL